MACPSLSTRWQMLGALVLMATAVAVSACSNSTGNSAAVQPLAKRASGSLPISFMYYLRIDDPNGSNTAVTGINDAGKIVGTYSVAGSGTNVITQSFTATGSGATYNFVGNNYPQPRDNGPVQTGTALVAINPGATSTPTVEAGWVVDPGSFTYTLGLLNNQGLWTLLHPFTGGGEDGSCGSSLMELNGINDAFDAVGVYERKQTTTKNSPCVDQAFEAKPDEDLSKIQLGSGFQSSAATGIDDPGASGSDIVGWGAQAITHGEGVGWYEKAGSTTPTVITIPNAVSVKALGINADGEIVAGSYSEGAAATTYGFLCSAPCGSSNTFQTPINPCSSNGCSDIVVYGINDKNDICGSYMDSNGQQHGFVGVPRTAKTLHRRETQSHSPGSLKASSAGSNI